MACHVRDADPRQECDTHYSVPEQPDLVLKSRKNVDLSGEIVEAAICRICHDIAEDAIKSTCRHLFDRACMQQYIEACGQDKVRLPHRTLVWDNGSLDYNSEIHSRPALFVTWISQSTWKPQQSSRTKRSRVKHGRAFWAG